MTREQSPRRGLVATNRSGEVSDQPVFSRTGEIGNDQQVLEQHVREVVEELNGLHPVTKLRLMPYDGRVDTAYFSFHLAADVIADLELLSRLLNTANWQASLRYDARGLHGSAQLWVDFVRVAPIKQKTKGNSFSCCRSRPMLLLSTLVLIFSIAVLLLKNWELIQLLFQ